MKIKKLLSVLLSAVLLFSVLPKGFDVSAASYTTYTAEQIETKLKSLRSSYPDGKYWRKSNGTTTICNSSCGSIYYNSKCGEYASSYQCAGYAKKISNKLFGHNCGSSQTTYYKITTYTSVNLDKAVPGDIVRARWGNATDHSLVITKVTDDYIYYTDCNRTAGCQIQWDDKISKTDLMKKIKTKLLDNGGGYTYGYLMHYKGNNYASTVKPVLTIKYNANGGKIPNSSVYGYKYKVTDSAGLNMRKGAGTSYSVVTTIPKGSTFTVNKGTEKTANGYTWSKATYGSYSGWVVTSDFVSKVSSLRNTKYYISSSMVYVTSSSSVLTAKWTYGTEVSTGLHNAATFGLKKDGYIFKGWSKATSGATVFSESEALKPEEIVSDLKNGDKTVTMYAIWEEESPTVHSFSYDASGGSGSMESVNVEEGKSITLSNSFTKSNCSFVGWNVKRNNDNCWYVTGKGWITEAEIESGAFDKKLYTVGTAYTIDDSWTDSIQGAGSYTFYAVWQDSTIESIAVTTIGKDNLYYVGDTLNTADMSLMIKRADGTYETVTEGFTCSPTTLSTEGTQTITVSYENYTTTYKVQVTKVKTFKKNATAKGKINCYMLPSSSSTQFYYTFADDELTILCKDGSYYLGFYPWLTSSITASNGVLIYIPTSGVTLNSGVTIPSASAYYTINQNAKVTSSSSVTVYRRTNTSTIIETSSDKDVTKVGTLTSGSTVKVLFEMNGYYCIQTSKFTGFVKKSTITLNPVLTGISIDEADGYSLSANVGEEISVSDLNVSAIYSDGSSASISDYNITLPDNKTAGKKYAVVSYNGFSTYVPVNIIAPNLTGIAVEKEPDKQIYLLDEAFEPEGMEIRLDYDNGTSEIITEGYSMEYQFDETGYSSIKISYDEFLAYTSVLLYDKPFVKAFDVIGYQGQTVNVPVRYYSDSDEISPIAFDTKVTYDKTNLQYKGFVVSDDLDASKLNVNESNGVINISYSDNQTISDDCVIIKAEFLIINPLSDVTEENIFSVAIDEFNLYDSVARSYGVEIQSGTVTSYKAGDADLDGNVNAADLIWLKQIILGISDEKMNNLVDVNNDSKNDILDLVRMKKNLSA